MGNQITSKHSSDPSADTSATPDFSSAQGLTGDAATQAVQAIAASAAANDPNRYARGNDETDVTPDVRVTSEFDMSQEGSIQAAGQIMGEVSVNFKSDVFPLEKLADTDMIQKLQSAQGAGRGATPSVATAGAATGPAPVQPAPAPVAAAPAK